MDFEIVAGATPQIYSLDVMNVTYNWFGVSNEAGVGQRVFDLDDWNIYTIANYTPFYTSEEQFINFWWNPPIVSLFWRGGVQHYPPEILLVTPSVCLGPTFIRRSSRAKSP